ncbi:MAG: hypothetical protein CME07_02620 [Gemmatimonadetes bacterium]|nr:hypothetical protein [Gemmatimonadota bacterium]
MTVTSKATQNPPTASPADRSPTSLLERSWLWGAVLVASALRLIHWHSMRAHSWFDFLGLDSKYYEDWAGAILAGGIQRSDPYFMGPLYPHLLALVHYFFGPGLWMVRFLQIGLSVATVVVAHGLGRRFGGRNLAMACSAMVALYGPLIYYSTSILYPTLTVFLAASLLLLLHDAARRSSLSHAFAAGFVMGVYALGRGNILLFAPAAFLWLACAWGREFSPALANLRRGLPGALVLTAGTLLAISPATIHNARTDDPTLLTTNGGLNLYIGNGPMARGGHETPVLFVTEGVGEHAVTRQIVADLHKDVECRTEAEKVTGRRLSFTEVNDFYLKETLRTIGGDPARWMSLMVMKAYHFWATYEIPQIEHFGYFRHFSRAIGGPAFTFLVLGPLAVLGMVLSWRRRRRWMLPYLFVGFYSASVIVFFVLARYRLPIVPALVLFAGVALVELAALTRARAWAKGAGAVAGAVAIGLFMSANVYGVDESKGIAQILYRHGIVSDGEGDHEAAVEHYRSALELKPEYDKCHLNLGVDLVRLGQLEEGLEHIRRAEEINPDYYRPPFNRGVILSELGRHEEAAEALRQAVAVEPRYLLGHSALGAELLWLGDVEGARREFLAVREYNDRWQAPHNDSARAQMGRYMLFIEDLGRLREAGAGGCFESDEDYRLAELTRLKGNVAAAIDLYRRLFERGDACPEASRGLGLLLLEAGEAVGAEDAFLRAAEAEPRLPGGFLYLGRTQAMLGKGEEAHASLQRASRADPSNPEPYLTQGLVREFLLEDPEGAAPLFDLYLEKGGDPDVLDARREARAPPPSTE